MNIVIIGAGTAGKYYLDILKKNNLIKKIFIVDSVKLIKSKSYRQIKFSDIKKIIHEIDSAIIATPSYLHFTYAKFFLSKQIDVLIEKPFTLKLSHASILAKLVKENKKKCWVAFQNRHNLAVTKLKDIVNKKKLGKIFLIDSILLWSRDANYYKVGWRGNYKTDGGVLANQAIHLLDILIYIFGPIVNFNVMAGFNKKKLKAEDLISLNFIHKNNVFSSLKATTRADRDYRSSIDVMGDKGRALIKGISMNSFYNFKDERTIRDKKNSEDFSLNLGPVSGMGNGHQKILKEFLNPKIKKSTQNLEIQDNIYVLKLIHTVYDLINTKKNVLFSVKNKESIWGK